MENSTVINPAIQQSAATVINAEVVEEYNRQNNIESDIQLKEVRPKEVFYGYLSICITISRILVIKPLHSSIVCRDSIIRVKRAIFRLLQN